MKPTKFDLLVYIKSKTNLFKIADLKKESKQDLLAKIQVYKLNTLEVQND